MLLCCSQQLRNQLAEPAPLLDIRVIFNSTRRDEHSRTDSKALCTLLGYSYNDIHFQAVLGAVLFSVKGIHVPIASPNYLRFRRAARMDRYSSNGEQSQREDRGGHRAQAASNQRQRTDPAFWETLTSLPDRVTGLEAENSSLRFKVACREGDIARLQQENERLRNAVGRRDHPAQTVFTNTLCENTQLEQHNSYLQGRIQDEALEIKKLKDTVQELRSQLSQVNAAPSRDVTPATLPSIRSLTLLSEHQHHEGGGNNAGTGAQDMYRGLEGIVPGTQQQQPLPRLATSQDLRPSFETPGQLTPVAPNNLPVFQQGTTPRLESSNGIDHTSSAHINDAQNVQVMATLAQADSPHNAFLPVNGPSPVRVKSEEDVDQEMWAFDEAPADKAASSPVAEKDDEDLPPRPPSRPRRALRSTGLRAPKRRVPSNHAESAPPDVGTERSERSCSEEVRSAVDELRRSGELFSTPQPSNNGKERMTKEMLDAEDEEDAVMADAGGADDALYEPPSEEEHDDDDEDVGEVDLDSTEDYAPGPSTRRTGQRGQGRQGLRPKASRAAAPSPVPSAAGPSTSAPAIRSHTKVTSSQSNGEISSNKAQETSDKRPRPDGEPDTAPEAAPPIKKPRYSRPRMTKLRVSIGQLPTGSVGFKFVKMPRTVRGIWNAWFRGTEDNPAIQGLEDRYGVAWRNGRGEMAYASDYVSKRKKIIDGVKKWARRYQVCEDTMIEMLDERARGRVATELYAAFKRDDSPDPFGVIKPRPSKNAGTSEGA
ncbi:High-osmolarity-induced transcription protein-like protein [Hapsidospora chrysogenum ATCC 11550]|uniref:High-osmolarity-induced transcription protein-like protein n=1 Tax=Hapsidospora chrysogenum (strain ATCC 11550 / CBS 779.69 / DSM 880 / IAM 14645 / JCM 23072 / IMI 49137) TaxID=857340 RepID=A0A086T6E1_HAPC1|nr:High-osmolarity-induced transcription protein-like protein [Hapsidospora chrysogenum ATCC 11550]